MENEVVTVAQSAAAMAHGGELTMMGLFWRADIVVKSVMLLLVLASIWCWGIIFTKAMKLRKLHQEAAKFERDFWSGSSIDGLFERIGDKPREPMSAVFAAAMREWRNAPPPEGKKGGHLAASVQQRIERVMAVTIGREMERVEKGLQVLASVGSTAPFIGLFGTVWGIMNSFTAIANEQSTNLAVVAPGIAEALFATALGLLAAIPAVIAFNKLAGDLGRYADRLDAFSAEFSAILSRTLEEEL
ncbi:MAG: protein TolQ [Alphaproteobacteria bacterium]|nr:protein TolQ [Alphaproteobacteria bacterium SS10]